MTTFVLVHGAFGSAAELAPVIPELEALGHRAIAVDLLAADGPPVQARFAGSCPHCGQRYAPGMTIGHVEDVGWVCEDCLT